MKLEKNASLVEEKRLSSVARREMTLKKLRGTHGIHGGSDCCNIEYDIKEEPWTEVIKKKAKVKKTVENLEVGAVQTEGKCTKITFTGDSGAVDHVTKKNTAEQCELRPTLMSKSGQCFRAANGLKIKVYGERHLKGRDSKDVPIETKAHVADITKNLASFTKMIEDDNDIYLSKKGSYIKNLPTGKKIALRIEDRVPKLDLWLKSKEKNRYAALIEDDEKDFNDSGFQRLAMGL